MKYTLYFMLALLLIISSCTPQQSDFSDWRGPNRDGIYEESGLLKQWPEDGPELNWSFEGLGFGHSAVAVANDIIYVNGVKDSAQSMGTIFALDLEGNLIWEKEYGKDFTNNFIGTRSTPVVVDDHIYVESGGGALYCLGAETGEEIWSKDFLQDFGVDSVILFGYSESVLIDGDQLICVPGGKEDNVVSLDRFSGEVIWTSPGQGEQATYNSPILVERGDQRLVIAMSSASIMGIDADNGEMYWRIEQTQGNLIHANTPIYEDGLLVVSSADAKSTSGLVQLQLSEDGKDAEVVWRNKKFRNLLGGLVKIDTCLYGSMAFGKNWQVIGWNTGEQLVLNKELGAGSIIYADGLFYCYTEADGQVALVDAGPEKFKIISSFTIPFASEQHWARPVIDNGVLYIRHGSALMAYQVKTG